MGYDELSKKATIKYIKEKHYESAFFSQTDVRKVPHSPEKPGHSRYLYQPAP